MEITYRHNKCGIKTTYDIIYNTLVNHPDLKQFWAALTEARMLEYEITTQTFKITEHGLRFLEVLSKLDQQQREEQERKNNIDNNNDDNNHHPAAKDFEL